MHVKRMFVALGAPLLIALLTVATVPTLWWQLLIVCGVALVVAIFAVKREYRLVACLAIIIAAVGIAGYTAKFQHTVTPVASLKDKTGVVQLEITDITKETAGSCTYEAIVTSHQFAGVPERFKTRLYTPTPLEVLPYDRITLDTQFFAIGVTSEFDAEQYYRAQDTHIFSYSYHPPTAITSPSTRPLRCYINKFNDSLRLELTSRLPLDVSGLVSAMLLGNSDDIPDATKFHLINAGAIHVTAVSGLHVSIIGAMLLFICRHLHLSRRVTALLTLVGVWLFVLLSGMSVSSIRAGIMMSMTQMATFARRQSDGLNALFIAGIIIVCQNPFAVTDLGFQLTFSCALGILVVSEPLTMRMCSLFGGTHRIAVAIIKSLAFSIAITVVSLPFALPISRGLQLATPLVNSVILPLAPLVLLGGIFILVTSLLPIPLVCSTICGIVSIIVRIIIGVSRWISQLPSLFMGFDYPGVATVVLISIGAIVLALWFNKEAVAPIFACVLAALVWCSVIQRGIYGEIPVITIFSSYEGNALVLMQHGSASVYFVNTDGYIGQTVARYLKGRNIGHISTITVLDRGVSIIKDIEYLTNTFMVEQIIGNADRLHPLQAKELLPELVDSLFVRRAGIAIVGGDGEIPDEATTLLLYGERTEPIPQGRIVALLDDSARPPVYECFEAAGQQLTICFKSDSVEVTAKQH